VVVQDSAEKITLFGDYEVLSLIGRGGMAEVHRARAMNGPHAGKEIALKRLMPEHSEDLAYVDLFTGEADVGRWLDHPHIVQLLDAGVRDNIFYIAMEWVEGHDLASILYRCQDLRVVFPIEFAVYIVSCVLEALAYAHAAFNPTGTHLRLVHCDVTPSNVFVSKDGEVKLGDFGVARARAVVGEGQSYGKPSYLAPEQIEGAAVNPRVDLWASGVILYELLGGRRPFRGESPERIAREILKAQPQQMHILRPEVPAALSEVLDVALHRDPEARYQTAEFFLEALEPFAKPIANPASLAQIISGLFVAAK
jgi:serine/threonine protein kinase